MTPWTIDSLPDLHDKIAIVTGANSGTGYCTARALARAGARVVIACRDPQRGEQALGRLHAEQPNGQVELASLDLADLDSVQRFADAILRDFKGIDMLVNNAGVMALPKRTTTAQGFEMQLGTNHLGHFALTCRLLPALVQRPGSRIVSVASLAHRGGSMHFDDLQSERRYLPWSAYGQSKLANLLFAFELERRLRQTNYSTLSVAAHPGVASTGLMSNGPGNGRPAGIVSFMNWANGLVAQSAVGGALPIIYAAAATDVAGGAYYGPGGLFELRGSPKRVQASRRANNVEAAQRLWDASEKLTGQRALELAQKAS